MQWYDHWLKGIDTGVLDGPPIKIWVNGANQWRTGDRVASSGDRLDGSLPDPGWQRCRRASPRRQEAPDSFITRPCPPLIMNPFPMDPPAEFLTYSTGPLEKDLEVVGP